MTDKDLEKTAVEKIEISLSMIHKNGTRWAVEKVFKGGRRGFHYDFFELKKQLPAIQQPVELEEPMVFRHYRELKALVDEHNKNIKINYKENEK